MTLSYRTSAALFATAALALTGIASPANAATLSRSNLTATLSGTSVTATATISASPRSYASEAGICVRDSAQNNRDFPKAAATLRRSGTAFTKTQTFAPGTYTYWACAKIDGTWNDIGARQSFTVTGASTAAAETAAGASSASAPSGQAMPVGDLANWKQVFTDDFTTPLARGSFPGSYASKWTAYDGFYDTFKTAYYDKSAISMHDGMMDLYLHTANGTPIGAAPAPIVTTAWKGQTYGRYSIRFKSDKLPGYKAAWLLWSERDVWNDGEIDFPEGNLDGTMWGFNHCLGNPTENCHWVDTKTTFNDWHTVTLEWSPGKVTYILDGQTLSTATNSVPTQPLKWLLQTESNGSGKPASNVAGSVLIDWVSVYTWKG